MTRMANIRIPAILIFWFAAGFPAAVSADASDGDFMGYRLNQRYPVTTDTDTGVSAGGNTQVLAENPVTPADIHEVRINCTVSSCTIGFIEAVQFFDSEQAARTFAKKYYRLLRAKYPGWRVQTGQMGFDDELRPVALSMDRSPHRLRIRLYEPPPGADPVFRIGIGLSYLPESNEQRAWTQQSLAERSMIRESSEERLLEDSDTRGL